MPKLIPFLWYDDRLQEALDLYASIFPHAKVISKRNGPDGKLFTATFEIEGQTFMGLNGGPMFKFTDAFSIFVGCETQAEVDHYYDALTADGGRETQCGWLKDKFGLSWQIVPNVLMRYLFDEDPAKAKRVNDAMMQMKKLDIATLDKAYAG